MREIGVLFNHQLFKCPVLYELVSDQANLHIKFNIQKILEKKHLHSTGLQVKRLPGSITTGVISCTGHVCSKVVSVSMEKIGGSNLTGGAPVAQLYKWVPWEVSQLPSCINAYLDLLGAGEVKADRHVTWPWNVPTGLAKYGHPHIPWVSFQCSVETTQDATLYGSIQKLHTTVWCIHETELQIQTANM